MWNPKTATVTVSGTSRAGRALCAGRKELPNEPPLQHCLIMQLDKKGHTCTLPHFGTQLMSYLELAWVVTELQCFLYGCKADSLV
jgi:hypothetical protein